MAIKWQVPEWFIVYRVRQILWRYEQVKIEQVLNQLYNDENENGNENGNENCDELDYVIYGMCALCVCVFSMSRLVEIST